MKKIEVEIGDFYYEYTIYEKSRTVTCEVTLYCPDNIHEKTQIIYHATSAMAYTVCSPQDTFDEKKGMIIARLKAERELHNKFLASIESEKRMYRHKMKAFDDYAVRLKKRYRNVNKSLSEVLK